MTEQTRFQFNESDLPKFWYNIYADSPVPPTPVLSWHDGAGHPRLFIRALPDGLDHAGDQLGKIYRDPGRSARDL